LIGITPHRVPPAGPPRRCRDARGRPRTDERVGDAKVEPLLKRKALVRRRGRMGDEALGMMADQESQAALVARRVAQAKQIVAHQHDRIAKLAQMGAPTADAEAIPQLFPTLSRFSRIIKRPVVPTIPPA
jgi:hypothetical protein